MVEELVEDDIDELLSLGETCELEVWDFDDFDDLRGLDCLVVLW